LFGETDGSSYPNGGMRATHTAGGYLCLDPASPVFLRDDCIYVPACFVSYAGQVGPSSRVLLLRFLPLLFFFLLLDLLLFWVDVCAFIAAAFLT
jgi:glutamine synthetase type III